MAVFLRILPLCVCACMCLSVFECMDAFEYRWVWV